MEREVYKVNGINTDKDTFMTKIVEALDTAKFASIDQLAIMLKARQSDIKKVLQDIIIWYVREHAGVSYSSLCLDLNVKSEYVDELVAAGRLFDKNDVSKEKQEVLKVQKTAEEVTSQFIKDLQRKEAIRGLSQSVGSPGIGNPQLRKTTKFYTQSGDNNNLKW